MDTNPNPPADTATDVQDEPRKRMLAARERIRRYFSPDIVAGIDPDEAEVVGGSAPTTPEFRGGR